MSRAERLIELLITIGGRPRFTAAALAAELGVSRRTILRDLEALTLFGVPLMSFDDQNR